MESLYSFAISDERELMSLVLAFAILAREFCQGFCDVGEAFDEATVEVGETKERLDVFD